MFVLVLLYKLEWGSSMPYYIIFIPFWVVNIFLLGVSQAKRFTTKVPFIGRLTLVSFATGICISSVLLSVELDYPNKITKSALIVPLYGFCGISLFFGIISLLVACCTSDPKRMNRHISVGVPNILAFLILTPFCVLIYLKIHQNPSLPWGYILIPLWISDGLAFSIGAILLLFTYGSRDSAHFTILQVILFLLFIVCLITFKVLLVENLDYSIQIPIYAIIIPLILALLLLITCGIDIRLKRNPSSPIDEEHKEMRKY